MRCPKGHEGATALFTSIHCPACDLDPAFVQGVVAYFVYAVDLFHENEGGKPTHARIPPSWKPVLADWQPHDAKYAYIGLIDGAEGELMLMSRVKGSLKEARFTW